MRPLLRRFILCRDRKKLAGALEQRFRPGRRLTPTGRPGEFMTRTWRWVTTKRRKPKPGGHWASYWRIRDSQTGRTVVNLGRDPDPNDPATVKVLLEYGLTPDDLQVAMKTRRRTRAQRLIAREAARIKREVSGSGYIIGGDRGGPVKRSGSGDSGAPARVDQQDRTGWARHGNPRK